ncbi:X-Pro dipeptidyl-peptidase [Halomicrobium zhouii]|uniref:Xaa-Pro dipeptidyl-peptidase n=1 Tax=Halomicrobium zhouii TaxID=767519 RepID=A0A1I6K9S1_9EURY|nr:CocE/NonD family hydrolase [Halomicrobium zhouii]SFR87972.1 X-Pro dipeptidyl-peptidase [Halomicrobium zhouii]
MADSQRGDAGDRSRSRSAGSLSRRRLLAAGSAAAVGASGLTGRTVATPNRAGLAAADAQGSDDERIEEEAWVETVVDTDGSGDVDRIYVRVSRPASTANGDQLPVIATASPYYGEQTHSDSTPEMLYDRAVELSASEDGDSARATVDATDSSRRTDRRSPDHRPAHASSLPDARALQRRYVSKGYVVAQVSSLGTHRSTGCYTAAGPPTIEALVAVVDWFNGRATAYDSPTGGATVEADWTTGTTGLIGASANGELANALATTGVDGLEAVVPQSANNGQYSLFRANGTPISVVPDESAGMTDLGTWVQAGNARRPACDHWTERIETGQDTATGDYNDFWHEREFLPDADAVDAAVLLTHAVDDPIVKPNNVADWYEALDAADVPLKLWLHEGGHRSPRGQRWETLLDRWWAYWLKDVDNGVMDEDPVTVVRGGKPVLGGSRETYQEWPVPGAEPVTLRFRTGGATAGEASVGDPDPAAESFVDDPSIPVREHAVATESGHRLRYGTPPLETSVHVSGRVVPSLSLSFDDPTVVSVALVEYGPSGADVVTRGWADPLNRPSYREYDSPVAYKQSLRESRPLDADEPVTVEFPLQATDHVFEEGSRIGLVVYATDREFTLRPPGNATVTLSLSESAVEMPVVGGETPLTDAFADDATYGEQFWARSSSGPVDGFGPGLAVGGALAALGAGGYLLKRRLAGGGDGTA